MEKTVKVSPGIYAQLCELADQAGLSYKLVADELMREGLRHLDTVPAIAQAVEADPNIRAVEEDGIVYYCEECGQVLDAEEKPEMCPKCGARIDWEHKPGGGMGFLGWGLVGLAALLVMGNQSRIARQF